MTSGWAGRRILRTGTAGIPIVGGMVDQIKRVRQ